MLDEGSDINLDIPGEEPPEESGNRTFLVVGGIIAALFFLTLVCFAVYLFVIRPSQQAAPAGTQTAVARQNLEQAQMLTATAEALLFTPTLEPSFTPTNTRPPNTPTVTPVLAVDTPDGDETEEADPEAVAATQTQQAWLAATLEAQGTRGIGGEGMPETGFFDEVGLPSLIVLALALVAVIFLARRLRKAPTR